MNHYRALPNFDLMMADKNNEIADKSQQLITLLESSNLVNTEVVLSMLPADYLFRARGTLHVRMKRYRTGFEVVTKHLGFLASIKLLEVACSLARYESQLYQEKHPSRTEKQRKEQEDETERFIHTELYASLVASKMHAEADEFMNMYGSKIDIIKIVG